MTVRFGLGTGAGTGSFSSVKDNGDGTYTATFTPTTPGSNFVTATIGGQQLNWTARISMFVPGSAIVTTNPASQVAGAGNSVTFVAAAVGTPTPTVQWQIEHRWRQHFHQPCRSHECHPHLFANRRQNLFQYRAVFTNSSGSAISNAATLSVNTTPSSLVVSASTGVFPQFNIVDPNPQNGGAINEVLGVLSNGNLVAVGTNSTVYLLNGKRAAVISSLTGGEPGTTSR